MLIRLLHAPHPYCFIFDMQASANRLRHLHSYEPESKDPAPLLLLTAYFEKCYQDIPMGRGHGYENGHQHELCIPPENVMNA